MKSKIKINLSHSQHAQKNQKTIDIHSILIGKVGLYRISTFIDKIAFIYKGLVYLVRKDDETQQLKIQFQELLIALLSSLVSKYTRRYTI